MKIQALKLFHEKDEKNRHSDDVQRLAICCSRLKDSLCKEQERSHQLELDIETFKYTVEANERALQLNYDTIAELKGVIGKEVLQFVPRRTATLELFSDTSLLSNLETAWRQKDAAHEREKITQDELKGLKETLDEQRDLINTLSSKRLAFRQ